LTLKKLEKMSLMVCLLTSIMLLGMFSGTVAAKQTRTWS